MQWRFGIFVYNDEKIWKICQIANRVLSWIENTCCNQQVSCWVVVAYLLKSSCCLNFGGPWTIDIPSDPLTEIKQKFLMQSVWFYKAIQFNFMIFSREILWKLFLPAKRALVAAMLALARREKLETNLFENEVIGVQFFSESHAMKEVELCGSVRWDE